ncbi:LacI family transcriptional regulator, partial [bacterium]
LEERPTAIVAGNDRMAYGLYDAARELGFRVPDDISVVGFDDDESATLVYPPLTTVVQPIAEMASAALDAVISLSEGGEAESRHFPTRLIVRASTSSPKRG